MPRAKPTRISRSFCLIGKHAPRQQQNRSRGCANGFLRADSGTGRSRYLLSRQDSDGSGASGGETRNQRGRFTVTSAAGNVGHPEGNSSVGGRVAPSRVKSTSPASVGAG
jgi:hypothetical protein